MEACFLQPIDVIKTRLQLDHTGQYKGVPLSCSAGLQPHLLASRQEFANDDSNN